MGQNLHANMRGFSQSQSHILCVHMIVVDLFKQIPRNIVGNSIMRSLGKIQCVIPLKDDVALAHVSLSSKSFS